MEKIESVAPSRDEKIRIGGEEVVYVFQLSKQTQEPYENCWMTDAFVIESWKNTGRSI